LDLFPGAFFESRNQGRQWRWINRNERKKKMAYVTMKELLEAYKTPDGDVLADFGD